MKIKIADSLKALPTIDYRSLKEFQGPLKDLSKGNYARLLNSLTEFGFIVPLFIWKHEGEIFCIDGHQRLRVLKKEEVEPFKLPFIEIKAETVAEAKKKLLVVSSQYGRITQEGLDQFAFDLDDAWLRESVWFDAVPFPDAHDSPGGAAGGTGDGEGVDGEGAGAGGLNYAIKYELVFNTEAEQDRWGEFLAYLKKTYPDLETISERVIRYLDEKGDV